MADIPVRTEFPRKVREIENAWIPMSDGVRLAARIWLPEDAEDDPVPAILEYLPYRKRDGTVERDHLTHPYFAGFGYASVRVDMRGTGDSEGVCLGEYLQQEQDDCLEVLAWLAAQPWCTGKAGMIGISWGGFNGLQLAALRPPELAAVISLCSTDDRYADDIHFMGGAVLTDKLSWGATAFSIAHTPPDPAIVGEDRWRDMWMERLEHNGLWMLDWFRHQRRDAFFQHGSICDNYADVDIPVYLVGGWADGYTNPIFRMLEHLPGPKKGLVGPWAHKYPHFAGPGPRIGFLQECLRWWDQHLKGIETGIMDEPVLRAWVQDYAPPRPSYDERPGVWVAETEWPPADAQRMTLALSPGRLSDQASDLPIEVHSPQTAGRYAPVWCQYGLGEDGGFDQNREASAMVVFETEPLAEDLHLLGFPILEAEVASDTPVANLIATLSVVDDAQGATLASFGVQNLTHRNSDLTPEPMTPGKAEPVRVQLNVCGQTFRKGQRIRLALSTAYWPMVFPAPEDATLTLMPGSAHLHLPVRAAKPFDATLAEFGPAEGAAPLVVEPITSGMGHRTVTENLPTGVETYQRLGDTGLHRHAHIGMEVQYRDSDTFTIHPGDPNSARGVCHWIKRYGRGDWRAEVETETSVEALATVWRIRATLVAREAGEEIFRREFSEDIPRDLV